MNLDQLIGGTKNRDWTVDRASITLAVREFDVPAKAFGERKEVPVKFSSLRRSDEQAKYAFVLAWVSLVPFLGAAGLILRNFRGDVQQIVYGSEGSFLPMFLGCLAFAAAPSALAFVLGWSSSGHRRNDRPGRSWFGFFVGGAVFTLCIIMALAFVMLRLKKPM